MKKSAFSKFLLPAIIWAALIFVLSSIPGLSPPNIGITFSDLIAHFIEYSILGFLITRALYGLSNDSLRKHSILLGIAIGVFYALTDEFHQSFVPGRTASLSDLTADAVGVLFAQMVFFGRFHPQKQREKK